MVLWNQSQVYAHFFFRGTRLSASLDVCIVGAGPAGLSAAIRLKQLEQEKGREIRVVVLEKGAEVGELLYYNMASEIPSQFCSYRIPYTRI